MEHPAGSTQLHVSNSLVYFPSLKIKQTYIHIILPMYAESQFVEEKKQILLQIGMKIILISCN
jgi:hypothetical protein